MDWDMSVFFCFFFPPSVWMLLRHVTYLYVTLVTCFSCLSTCAAVNSKINPVQGQESESQWMKRMSPRRGRGLRGAYNSYIIEWPLALLWCICGGCGQTHLLRWELKTDQSYPLTIWPCINPIHPAACTVHFCFCLFSVRRRHEHQTFSLCSRFGY